MEGTFHVQFDKNLTGSFLALASGIGIIKIGKTLGGSKN